MNRTVTRLLNELNTMDGAYMLVLIIGSLLMIELIALAALRFQVPRYARYWDERATEAGELTYVALGDSAAQSIGASRPEKGYVGILASRLEEATGCQVQVINLSRSGARLDDVLDRQLPELGKYAPDVVTIEIGANDVAEYDSNAFRQEFDAVVDRLPSMAYVADMPEFGFFHRTEGRAAAISARESIARRDDIVFVPLEQETTDRLGWTGYSADLFHPNDTGYRIWADAFWRTLVPYTNTTGR